MQKEIQKLQCRFKKLISNGGGDGGGDGDNEPQVSQFQIGDILLTIRPMDNTWIETNGFNINPSTYPILSDMLFNVEYHSPLTNDVQFLGMSERSGGYVLVGQVSGEGGYIWLLDYEQIEGSDFVEIGIGGGALNSVDSDPSEFLIAVGDAGNGRKSTDPSSTTWNVLNIGFGSLSAKVIKRGRWGLWLIAGESGKMTSSTDGTTFADLPNPFGASTIYSICENSDTFDRFVAVGADGKIMYSDNGLDWTMVSSGVTDTLFTVIHANEEYFAAGANGTMVRSLDGITWTAYQNSVFDNNTIYTLSENYGMLIASGQRGIVSNSKDGSAWDQALYPDDGANFRTSSYGFIAGTRSAIGIVNSGVPNIPDVGIAKHWIKGKL